ncbi:F-type H+-transporting ATPase subunit b [Desulfatibacillum alkenivorans DSM 16219]|jgi:F-type H+-transporting ATPase subunit b|uniref:ATP synthase subunit b n=1 Tax=Desulfatibacillum alkenivorans DSM 16219 TaxID=1121393 RepID=A0A1M6KE75_9BACT|nr:ATP synthase F0 subunit B [Desulfatibacillum alkenivorans]SHJ57243.1 F-type H+-transporting ATPase subunit b [Desulfatibacillum alkenivorans DSM 16219]
MEVVSNIALISINETLVVQVISFLIFLFIAKKFIFTPLQDSMGERDSQIKGAQDDIAQVKQEMDAMAAELAKHEADAKSKALSLKNELEDEGKKEALDIVNAARKDIEGMRAEAAAQVDDQIAQARRFFQAESEALSISIMESMLGRKVS